MSKKQLQHEGKLSRGDKIGILSLVVAILIGGFTVFQWLADRAARSKKPRVEVSFMGLSWDQLQLSPAVTLALKPDRSASLAFEVRNLGQVKAEKAQAIVWATPNSVFLDETGKPLNYKVDHNQSQFLSADLEPNSIFPYAYIYRVDIIVPPDLRTFDLNF